MSNRAIIVNKLTPFQNRAIVFYNVENLFDTKDNPHTEDNDFTPDGYKQWDENRYNIKLDKLASVIGLFKTQPLFIGLAEIENRYVLEDLIQATNHKDYGIVHFNSPDKRGIDCALLYDTQAATIIESYTLTIELENDWDFVTRDILCVHAQLKDDIELYIFVNHWSSRREGKYETEHKRIAAAKTLRNQIDDILALKTDANIVVMGDFNDHPDDNSLEHMLRAKEAGHAEEDDLINLLYDEHQEGEGTAVYRGDWAVLDQIIISQSIYRAEAGLGIISNDAAIIKKDELLFTYHSGDQKPAATYGGKKYYGGYSDHLPVYIALESTS